MNNSTVTQRKRLEGNGSQNGDSLNASLRKSRMQEAEERANLVLWKHPLRTFQYFFLEVLVLFRDYGVK